MDHCDFSSPRDPWTDHLQKGRRLRPGPTRRVDRKGRQACLENYFGFISGFKIGFELPVSHSYIFQLYHLSQALNVL